MSFMFNCYPHHDATAVNRPEISPQIIKSVVSGTEAVCEKLSSIPNAHFALFPDANSCIIALDGYVGSRWESLLGTVMETIQKFDHDVSVVDMTKCFRPPQVLEHTGFEVGGVPPLGHTKPIRTLIDGTLARFDTVWAAAGSANAVFPISFDGLVSITGGEVMDLVEKGD